MFCPLRGCKYLRTGIFIHPSITICFSVSVELCFILAGFVLYREVVTSTLSVKLIFCIPGAQISSIVVLKMLNSIYNTF